MSARGVQHATAAALRAACRAGTFRLPTPGQAPGHVQANLVILPRAHAGAFAEFCANNAAPCPLLEQTPPGVFEARQLAPGSDVRSDLPKYHVWRDGRMVEERDDVTELCTADMQAFLLGCSFTWEDVLVGAGLTPRHVEEGSNVPMFDSSIPLRSSGPVIRPRSAAGRGNRRERGREGGSEGMSEGAGTACVFWWRTGAQCSLLTVLGRRNGHDYSQALRGKHGR